METTTRREFLGQAGKGLALAAALPTARALGANDRIRIGLIGAGDRGMEDLKNALKQPNIDCVAIADIYSRNRDRAKKVVPNATTYDDPMKLLESKDVDAVINATPLHLHKRYFVAALQAGKDLYSEKTMTWDIPEAVECKKAAAASKQVVQIGLQHESSGELKDALQWIRDGKVGKVASVDAWMSRNTPIGKGQWVRPVPPDCNPDHVNWKLFLDGRKEPEFDGFKYINWRLFWEFSGGNVTENMVHQVAWIITALDLDLPRAASMMGGVFSEKDKRQVPDTMMVSLEYPDMLVNWQSTFSNARYGLGEHILGDKGTIEHVSGSTDMVTGKSQSSITYLPEKVNNADSHMVKGESKDTDHMANWFECIRDRKQPNASVDVGYKSAIAAHMSNLAFREKRRITLEEAMATKRDAYL